MYLFQRMKELAGSMPHVQEMQNQSEFGGRRRPKMYRRQEQQRLTLQQETAITSGPLITRFGRKGNGKGQFDMPCGVAVTRTGDILVVDTENSRIQVFTADGSLKCVIGEKGSQPHQLNHPLCIVLTADTKERLLVTDSVNAAIKVFEQDGSFVAQYGDLFDFPYGIALTSDQHIVVTDICRHTVQVLSPSGFRRYQFGQYGDGLTDFDQPYFVAVNGSNQIVVCDTGNTCIKMFTLEGDFVLRFTMSDFKLFREHFVLLQGLTVDAADNIIVIGNCTVYIVARNGRLWEVLQPEDGLHSPKCVASCPSGQLVVTQCPFDHRHEVSIFKYWPEHFESLKLLPPCPPENKKDETVATTGKTKDKRGRDKASRTKQCPGKTDNVMQS